MSPINKFIRAGTALNQLSHGTTLKGGDIIYQIPSGDMPQVIGNPYLDQRWSISSISLYEREREVDGNWTRFNIVNYEFEIKTESGIRILPASRVKNIVLIDSVSLKPKAYVNFKEMPDPSNKLEKGFYEILVDGNLKLFKQIDIEVAQPTYNAALNVGSKDYKIIRKEKFFYFDKEINVVKRKNLESLGDFSKTFMKKEDIDVQKEEDLVKLFTYLNAEH
jgi:hypothetical protein